LQSVIREETYRFYIAKELQLVPQSKWLIKGLDEILGETETDSRSAEEIADDIIERAGLIFD